MHAIRDFFTTDYGLMSAAVIAIMFGMAGFFGWFFRKQIRADAERAEREGAPR